MAESGARAGGRRLLRLAVATGAASIGTIAISLLVGGAAASAAEDGVDGGAGAAGSAVGAAIPLSPDPDVGLAAAITVVEPAGLPAPEPAAPAAELVETVAVAAEVVPAAVAEAVPAAVAEVVPALPDPLASVTEPVASLGGDAVEVVASALESIAEGIDPAVDAVPVADALLQERSTIAVPTSAAAEPSAPEPAVTGLVLRTAAGDASVVAASGAVRWSPSSGAAVPGLPASELLVDLSPDAGPDPGPPALAPSGAGGGAAGQPPATLDARSEPELPGGSAGAVEHDRVPASLVEELAASPD